MAMLFFFSITVRLMPGYVPTLLQNKSFVLLQKQNKGCGARIMQQVSGQCEDNGGPVQTNFYRTNDLS
jgi:hypothetical protein